MQTQPLHLSLTRFKKTCLAASMLSAAFTMQACSSGGSGGDARASDDPNVGPQTKVELTVSLPQRMQNLGVPIDVVVTVSGTTQTMSKDNYTYFMDTPLAKGRKFPIFFAVRRSSDGLILADAQYTLETDSDTIAFALPPQIFNTNHDSDSDGFSNIAELERGSAPLGVSEDFDGDGIANDSDSDDDNDGVPDIYDAFPLDATESIDTDGDGIGNNLDYDDDNDLIVDVDDKFPLDANESLDLDLDGLGNSVDLDDDGDGTIDLEDPQPNNPNITGNEDSDGDGIRDLEDAFPYDPSEHNDLDGDGIGDNADADDNGNGIADDQENSIVAIPYSLNRPNIDGAYGWREWTGATRSDSKGNYLKIDHLMIDVNNQFKDQPRQYYNYSYWRAKHDGTHLYILAVIYDEPFYEIFGDSTDIWEDDTADLYFDIGNDKASTYGSDDYHQLFRYHNMTSDNKLVGYNSAPGMNVSYSTSAGMEMPGSTRTVYEFKVSLSSIGLVPEQRFGFDIHVNDDIDGGDRDAKWGWFAPSDADNSWQDPSVFGTAILAPIRVVNPGD